MTDDLVKRLRKTAAEMRRYGHTAPLTADELDTIATRLATPPGDAVEMVARALYRAECAHVDEYEADGDWDQLSEAGQEAYRKYGRTAVATLSSISAPTDGEKMREAAAQCAGAWKRADALRLAAGEMTAQELRTAQAVAAGIEAAILALPLPPAEERT